MIPYDDLVAALSAWRARQGLPVSTLGGGAPGSGPHASPGSGPHGQPGSGPNRGAPPAPPSGRHGAVPPPLEVDADSGMHEVEADMLEEQYENEGNDFAMSFGGGDGGDSTAIGGAPERPTDPNDFNGGGRGGRGGRGEDW